MAGVGGIAGPIPEDASVPEAVAAGSTGSSTGGAAGSQAALKTQGERLPDLRPVGGKAFQTQCSTPR